MDALYETHRSDDLRRLAPPATSMRTALTVAMLLTILIGLTVITSAWRSPPTRRALDQPWSLMGPRPGPHRAAHHQEADAERYASSAGRTGMCAALRPAVGGYRDDGDRED